MWLAIFNRGLLFPYESYRTKAISYHAHLRSVTSRLLPVFAGSCKCKARLLYEPVLRRAVESLWLRQLHGHGEGFLIDEGPLTNGEVCGICVRPRRASHKTFVFDSNQRGYEIVIARREHPHYSRGFLSPENSYKRPCHPVYEGKIGLVGWEAVSRGKRNITGCEDGSSRRRLYFRYSVVLSLMSSTSCIQNDFRSVQGLLLLYRDISRNRSREKLIHA